MFMHATHKRDARARCAGSAITIAVSLTSLVTRVFAQDRDDLKYHHATVANGAAVCVVQHDPGAVGGSNIAPRLPMFNVNKLVRRSCVPFSLIFLPIEPSVDQASGWMHHFRCSPDGHQIGPQGG